MSSKTRLSPRLALRPWVPYALLALAAALSFAASSYVASTARDRALAEFRTAAREAAQQIQFRISTYLELVRTGGALLGASNEINASEFRRFVAGLQLMERYPGMEGIGFAERVQYRDVTRFIGYLALEGTNVRLRPEGRRDEYYPVIFLEPRELRDRSAIGFDLAVHPELAASMARARDTGELVASPVLSPPAPFGGVESDRTVLVLQATYRTGADIDSLEQRRRELVGFVLAPLRLAPLLQHLSEEIGSGVAFQIYDSSTAEPLDPPRSLLISDPIYRTRRPVQIADRQWDVLVSSTAGARAGVVTQAAQRTWILGLFLSLLLFLITRMQVRAWEASARHEVELQASESALRSTEGELRRAVEHEREASQQAQRASRAKDEFLTMVSHELRTPLNAVVGWVDMLRHDMVPDDRRQHALETIDRNARLQAQLIDDLLDVSRIGMGKLRLDLRLLTLDPLVVGVIESLRPAAEAKRVQLELIVKSADLVVRADADRLQQIVWNLVSNAVKFTPSGGRVEVELERAEGSIELRVRDTGIGIEPEFLPHVFERFRQADSSTTRLHGGVGLGLAIVNDLVNMHGGSITAESAGSGRGATFLVRLPLAQSDPAQSAAREGGSAGAQLDGLRVLVVDDDPQTRELLSEALSAMRARVSLAASAEDAMHRLASEGADVLVSDIAMPQEDGLSLIRRVRGLPGSAARIPAVAVTAYARAEDGDRAIEAGYQISLTKPVVLLDLQRAIASLAGRT